ncbi:MAG: hypothetical protein RIR10_330, partial [Planctomycetota bacterium]
MLLAIAFLIAQQLTSPFATHATAAELFAAPMSDAMHAMHDVHEGHALAHQSLLDDAVPPPALPPARGTSDIWLSKNLPAIPRWPLLQREAIDRLIADSVARLLALQAPIPSQEELPNAKRCEWSYECLYRCGNEPPVAFRVGGTSIVGIALLAAPGLADDAVRRAALLRAIDQVANLATDPEISIEEYDGGFDVRNWAHCFGVRFLIAADRAGLVTDDRRERIHRAIARYADALLKSELPARGGWNYFREDGAFLRGHACTFLSAHCIVSLLDVRDGGYAISISGGDGAAGESAGPRTEPAQSTQPAPPTDAPTDVSTSTSTSTPARDLARERRALDEVIARAFAAIESARQPS